MAIKLNNYIIIRDFITQEMRAQDPDGFSLREPTAKKKSRGTLVALGPHHEWSTDGHDKLAKLGFGIWAIRDKWGGKWLCIWVVPNNRLKRAIAYLYLSLVRDLKGVLHMFLISQQDVDPLYLMIGMPIQSTTDCGSETTLTYALANALRYVAPLQQIDH